MGRKRKQSREGAGGGGGGPRISAPKKRRAVEAETVNQTETKGSPPDSDEGAPEVAEIIKVELDTDLGTVEEAPTQQELFDDSGNLDLTSDPDPADVEIGEVNLMRVPKEELIFEDEDVGVMDSIMVTATRSIGPYIGEYVHGFPSTSNTSDSGCLVSPTEYGNDAGGEENNKTILNTSGNANGNPLLNEMRGGSEDATRAHDEDVDEVTAATRSGSQHLTEPEGTTATATEDAQEMLLNSESVQEDVSKDLTGATDCEKDVEDAATIHYKDKEIARLKLELQAAKNHNEFLQLQVDSKNFRIEESSKKMKLSEDEFRSCTAPREWLEGELGKAKSEKDELRLELHTNTIARERQPNQSMLLEGEHRKPSQENSTTVERLHEHFYNATKLIKNALSEKDSVIKKLTDEVKVLKEELKQLDTEKDPLTNSVIPKQTCENKRLKDKDDSIDWSIVIAEKDEIIQNQAGEIEGLQKDLKKLEENSNKHRAEPGETRKLLDEKSKMTKRLQDEVDRKTDLLKHTLSESEHESKIAKYRRAKYFRDKQGNSELHLAVQRGDEEAVKWLIELDSNVNATNNNSETPLILAAGSKLDGEVALKIVKCLIEHDADMFATDNQGYTFLHKFARREGLQTPTQFHDLSGYLVSKNLSRLFNIKGKMYSRTPLMLAAASANLRPETVSLLHMHKDGVDFALEDNSGESLLFYAINVHKHLTPDTANNKARTADAADEKLVKLLVSLGADLNKQDHVSRTSLHCAAVSRNATFAMNMIMFLIDSGANVYVKDTYSFTFLHSLILFGAKITPSQLHDMVAFLVLNHHSRLFNVYGGPLNNTPLQLAVTELEIETATLSLLKNNVGDFNAVDRDGKSVLHYATMGNRSLKLISDLVDLGANAKHLSKTNENMLHTAAYNGNVELLKFFMEKGLDVNAQDNWGQTPLYRIFCYNSKDSVLKTVQFLLKNGAKSELVDVEGKTPRDYFMEKREWIAFADADKIIACLELASSC